MSNFTPGPWEYKKVWQSPSYEVFREMCHIANVYGAGKKDKGNAHLIAAAPEMYECLKEFINAVDTARDFSRLLDAYVKANALLRRIEGDTDHE